MASLQSFRSLLSYSMIGSLCVQRLGVEMLTIVSVLLSPTNLPGEAIVHMFSQSDQLCVNQTMLMPRVAEYDSTKQV
jgi:hypothetical protein